MDQVSQFLQIIELGVKIGVFVTFFSAAAVAIRYHDSKRVRTAFLVLFFTFILVPGMTGMYVWPFFSWHLYEAPGPERVTLYEMRLSDASGSEIRYDARATPPIVGSITRRYAGAMVGDHWNPYTDNETLAMACYFLTEARDYRERIEHHERKRSLVPRHQRDFKWTREKLEAIGEFERLRIYFVETYITSDGTSVVNRTDERVLDIGIGACQ